MLTKEQLNTIGEYTDEYIKRIDVAITLDMTPAGEVADLFAFIEYAKGEGMEAGQIGVTVIHDLAQFTDTAQGHPQECAVPRTKGYVKVFEALKTNGCVTMSDLA